MRKKVPDLGGSLGGPARPTRMTITIGEGREAREGYEVIAPTRLWRAWQLLSAVSEELHADGADEAGARRAAAQFNMLRDEVIRSVSPPLAAEARRLFPPLDEHCGVAGTRTACSGALGWLDGLMTSMLLRFARQSRHPNGALATRSRSDGGVGGARRRPRR